VLNNVVLFTVKQYLPSLFDEAHVFYTSKLLQFFVFGESLAQSTGIIVSENRKKFEQVIWAAAKDTDLENKHLTKHLGILTAFHPALCQSPVTLP